MNFPLLNPVQGEIAGGAHTSDSFVTGLTSAGQVIYSTYLGAPVSEYSEDMAVDAAGSVYLTGEALTATDPSIGPGANAPTEVSEGGQRAFGGGRRFARKLRRSPHLRLTPTALSSSRAPRRGRARGRAPARDRRGFLLAGRKPIRPRRGFSRARGLDPVGGPGSAPNAKQGFLWISYGRATDPLDNSRRLNHVTTDFNGNGVLDAGDYWIERRMGLMVQIETGDRNSHGKDWSFFNYLTAPERIPGTGAQGGTPETNPSAYWWPLTRDRIRNACLTLRAANPGVPLFLMIYAENFWDQSDTNPLNGATRVNNVRGFLPLNTNYDARWLMFLERLGWLREAAAEIGACGVLIDTEHEAGKYAYMDNTLASQSELIPRANQVDAALGAGQGSTWSGFLVPTRSDSQVPIFWRQILSYGRGLAFTENVYISGMAPTKYGNSSMIQQALGYNVGTLGNPSGLAVGLGLGGSAQKGELILSGNRGLVKFRNYLQQACDLDVAWTASKKRAAAGHVVPKCLWFWSAKSTIVNNKSVQSQYRPDFFYKRIEGVDLLPWAPDYDPAEDDPNLRTADSDQGKWIVRADEVLWKGSPGYPPYLLPAACP